MPDAEEYEPDSHKMHSELDVAPQVKENVPGTQSKQLDTPTWLEYLPAEHEMHDVIRDISIASE